MKLNLGSLELPINSATKTFAILAKRGAGKSYTGAVMAEEFYKNSIPFVVFDPIDVWWGLRLNKDGKGHGLPIVVFGVEHADIKLDREMGKRIAQAVVKENVSCVISTFGLPKVAQRHLITEFSEEILNINDIPRHIFIEEAHEFVPQRVFGGLGKTFNAVSNLVVMGRNRGLGVTLINQRAATINKDVLTQIDTLLAFRNVSPQDRKALREWVEFHSAEGDFDKFMKSLPSLPTGEGWIWSPEFLNLFEKIKVRERETFHPDREKIGDKFVMPKLEQIDIEGFIDKFKVLSEKKEIDTVMPKKNNRETISQDQLINKLKNDYESELIKKDIKIKSLESILDSIKKLVNNKAVNGDIHQNLVNKSNIDMWIQKLGNGSPAKILKFLYEKDGLKFSRSQIRLALGISAKSSGLGTSVSLLKTNNLIIEEAGKLYINPEL